MHTDWLLLCWSTWISRICFDSSIIWTNLKAFFKRMHIFRDHWQHLNIFCLFILFVISGSALQPVFIIRDNKLTMRRGYGASRQTDHGYRRSVWSCSFAARSPSPISLRFKPRCRRDRNHKINIKRLITKTVGIIFHILPCAKQSRIKRPYRPTHPSGTISAMLAYVCQEGLLTCSLCLNERTENYTRG